MNDFTIQDIAIFLTLAETLTDEKREALLVRLDAAATQHNGVLPDDLIDDLITVLHNENIYIEERLLPDQEWLEAENKKEYREEIDHVQPQLVQLVDDYNRETDVFIASCKKGYQSLDKDIDTWAQGLAKKTEATEIETIRHRLSTKKSSH